MIMEKPWEEWPNKPDLEESRKAVEATKWGYEMSLLLEKIMGQDEHADFYDDNDEVLFSVMKYPDGSCIIVDKKENLGYTVSPNGDISKPTVGEHISDGIILREDAQKDIETIFSLHKHPVKKSK